MVDITRGDVLLCDLNPVLGTEQAGIRPVVVVEIDRANAVSPFETRYVELNHQIAIKLMNQRELVRLIIQ